MTARFVAPFFDTGSGISPSDGSKLTFKNPGLETLKDTFSDAAGSIANTNPVIAGATGLFSNIYINGNYDVVLQDKNSVQIWADSVSEFALVADSANVKNFPTLAAAVVDTDLTGGDALNIAERTDGNGGGFLADVVLSSTVTENTFNIIQATGVGTLSIVVRTADGFNLRQIGADGTGATETSAAILAAIALGGNIEGVSGDTYLVNSELNLNQAGMVMDWKGSTVKVDTDFPNTDNVILISALNVTCKNGEVNGNKANIVASFPSGSKGNGVLVIDGGSGARVLNMHTHDSITNGQGALSLLLALDDVLFRDYLSEDNTFTGIGGEASATGVPITNIRFEDGETTGNDLGGDLRIQGCTNFLVSNHNGHNSDHGGAVIGVGEGKNITTGLIANSRIGNDNVGLPTLSIDGLVGGSGPNAGELELIEVDLSSVTLTGNGGSTGLLTQNNAIVTGHRVTSKNHSFNFSATTGSIQIIDSPRSQISTAQGYNVASQCEYTNLAVEQWGSSSKGILLAAGSDDSIIVNAALGARLNASGSHDGASNVAIMSDSTAVFVAGEHVGRIIRNTTDGSQGTITANSTTTVTATLSGGTDDDWDASDDYKITIENGADGIGITGTPANITLDINAYTGTTTIFGGIGGSVLNTWDITSLGASNIVEFIDGIAAPAAETSKSKMYVNVAGGLAEMLHSDGQIETMSTQVSTTAALAAIGDAINTSGKKFEGQPVWNTTTNKPVWANGSADGDVWIDATGSTAHTPV